MNPTKEQVESDFFNGGELGQTLMVMLEWGILSVENTRITSAHKREIYEEFKEVVKLLRGRYPHYCAKAEQLMSEAAKKHSIPA